MSMGQTDTTHLPLLSTKPKRGRRRADFVFALSLFVNENDNTQATAHDLGAVSMRKHHGLSNEVHAHGLVHSLYRLKNNRLVTTRHLGCHHTYGSEFGNRE